MISQQHEQHEPVAIVGMGCRWPGGSHDTTAFWNFLCNKVDGWKMFGYPRFSAEGFHHPNADRPGGFAMKGAFLVEQDARLFDHSFFGMTGLEVETMDPSQRKLLEVAYEAIENAGETWESISGTRTGVFVGNFCLDHWMIQSRDWDNPRPYAFVGAGTSILANRISYIFNLQGPSLTIDTACSSSMYALHLAVNAIRAGDCDSAIVASANWIGDPGVQIALDKLGALSASSRCHTFDARAEGYARGEGYGALYLKRPSLAIADNSPVRAMIRGTAINSNGRTGGITRPSVKGQEKVIREAYRSAGGLPYQDTSYFECHGTGTYVGDPIEMAAVGKVFAESRSSDDPLLVGSVKSNIGHGEGASALASVMKVVLALEKGIVPPIYDLRTRNPNIDFEGANVLPVTELSPWPENRLRRASINSFGYGGANAHCIIDHVENVLPEYIAPGIFRTISHGDKHENYNGVELNGDAPHGFEHVSRTGVNGITTNDVHVATTDNVKAASTNDIGTSMNGTVANGTLANGTSNLVATIPATHEPILQRPALIAVPKAPTRELVLLPFSGHNENSLQMNIKALSDVIDNFSLADVAYTLSDRRSRYAQRSFCLVGEKSAAQDVFLDKKPIRAPLQQSNVGFIFTGQGAQWHGMGVELFEYQVFRKAITYLDRVLQALPNPPVWSLQAILSGECDPTLVQTAEVAQAICTAVQIGLVDLLASWFIRPAGVVGHSSGEIAAAYASGHISAAGAIVTAYLRGQAVSRNDQTGMMLAVGLGIDEVTAFMQGREDEIKVAAINSPGSVTLSGDTDAIDEISAAMTAGSIFNRKLKTGGNAYHSHHMLPIGQDYLDMLAEGTQTIHRLGLDGARQRYLRAPWVSSVTPHKEMTGNEDLVSYWRANLESPVRFSEAIAGLVGLKDVAIHVVVEIGPHPALKSPVEQILKSMGKAIAYTSTLKRQEDGRRSLLQLAGSLFCLNAAVDLTAVNATYGADGKDSEHGCTCTNLPPYQYTYGPLNYHESRASREYRYRSIIRHDLLGSKVVGTAKLRPQWRNILRMKDVPWLGHHRLVPDAVLPGAGYLAMVTEAATRIHNEFPEPLRIDGFRFADVAIEKGLVIPEDDYGVEILTSMELVDGTTAQSTSWTTFSISSVNRETQEWTEHCTGRVSLVIKQVGGGAKMTVPTTERAVDAGAWYRRFAKMGLGYGPTFQPLSNISTDASDSNVAVATLDLHTTRDLVKGGESHYPLHPAALDGVIQLGLIACHGGRHSDAKTAYVPVRLARFYLSNDFEHDAGDSCIAVARGERRGIRGAHLDLHLLAKNGKILAHVEDLRCVSFSSTTNVDDKAFSSPFTRLVWQPDIRFLSFEQARRLFPPPGENVRRAPSWAITNRLAHFVVFSIFQRFGHLHNNLKPAGEVGHFYDWIQRKGQNDNSLLMDEARKLANEGQLLHTIDNLVDQAPDVMEVRIAKLLHDNMDDILYERRTGIDVILGEDLLTPLYRSGLLMTGIYPQLHKVLSGLAHSNPNARVLEIGGGTGGATRIAMKAFNGPNGIKAYHDYTFTDISAGFLSAAHESMAHLHDMNFSVFDIEVDPVDQGYVEQAHDLIIACQVLHATSNMHRTLTNCRRLLKPGGKLVLVETTENFIVPGVVVGTFTGYWAGIPDGRLDAPFQSLSDWDRSLRDAGFSGLEVVLDDFPEPHNTTSVILSTVPTETPQPQPQPVPVNPVYILHGGDQAPSLIEPISKALEQQDVPIRTGTFDAMVGMLPPESRVVALFDETLNLSSLSEGGLHVFQQLSRNAASLVALTSYGVIDGRNPDGALIPGLLRVLQNENPATNYISIDIDANNFDIPVDDAKSFARFVVDHALNLHRGLSSESLNSSPRDREFSWHDGCVWVSRHVPDAGFHSQYGLDSRNLKPELLPFDSRKPFRATFESPGVLNSLCFTPYREILQPLPPSFIDVEVAAVGLNAHDLDHWTGRVDEDCLSSEYAGTVKAIGADVTDLEVGDRVYGLGKGQFGNRTRVPAAMASKLDSRDDFVQVASMPVAYTTAIYVLEFVAKLRKGQSVLVQSDAKDLGVALLSLASAKGADVVAMSDTADQATVLSEHLGIPASRVMISEPIRGGFRGSAQVSRFDVIISSAQGELLGPMLELLAPLGHFVSLRRAGAQSAATMNLENLPHNASFSRVDPFVVLNTDVDLSAELMQSMTRYYRQGLIGPIPNLIAMDIASLGSTIGHQASVAGKMVATFASHGKLVKTVPSPPSVLFDPHSCYIITGALSGLGQSLVQWMANRGAKQLALLSRRDAATVPGVQEFIKTLGGRGVRATCYVCDVSNKIQLTQVIQEIAAEHPIKGIVHAAVSYLDRTFARLELSRWSEGLSAKVVGTKNLHEALLSVPLDFFVMTTSALSVYAFPTQGAYTAANNFQDAFARYRRRKGLPASTISFSLIQDVSEVGKSDLTINLFERNKALMLDEAGFLQRLESAFLDNKTAETPKPDQWLGQLHDPLSAANLHTYLDPAAMLAKEREELATGNTSSIAVPRWHSDGRISLIRRALDDAKHRSTHSDENEHTGSKTTVSSIRKDFHKLVAEGAASRTATVAFAQEAITGAVAEMLFVDVEGIDSNKSVADLGVDSLIAAELRNWFLQALEANISILDLLDPGMSIVTRAESIVDKALGSK